MDQHLKIVGFLLVALALLHLIIPRYFKWQAELRPVSLLTRQIFYVHTFFIALVVLLMGLLCILYSHELLTERLGRVICLGLGAFWALRAVFQFFVYSPRLWRGKKFETTIHILFSIAWIYFAAVFLSAFVGLNKW